MLHYTGRRSIFGQIKLKSKNISLTKKRGSYNPTINPMKRITWKNPRGRAGIHENTVDKAT